MPQRHNSSSALDVVAGIVQKQLFRDNDNGFTIFSIQTDNGETVTVHGTLAHLETGRSAECKGVWFTHPSRGRQFRAQHIGLSAPTSSRGIEAFLASPRFRGIGKQFAKRLTEKFGDRLVDVIEQFPMQLEAVRGFGPKKRIELVNAWNGFKAENAVELEIQTFLRGLGLGDSRCNKIYAKYGKDTKSNLQKNPYALIRDFAGIGFLTADRVAHAIGVSPSSPLRIRACIGDYLKRQAIEKGDCAKEKETLVHEVAQILKLGTEHVLKTVEALIAQKHLVLETKFGAPVIYLPRLHRAEQGIADELCRIGRGKLPWTFSVDQEFPHAQAAVPFPLAESQIRCIRTVLSNKLSCITGGPGVGKTSILSSILAVLKRNHLQVVLASPTGKAAERMSEATGMSASTVHRLLEFDGRTRKFRRNRGNPLNGDVFVIDELSMLDVPTAFALLQAIPDHAVLILIGDPDQLPAVGVGAVLDDILKSKTVPVGRLTEVFRQGPGSGIIRAARQILEAEVPWDYVGATSGDFRIILIDDAIPNRSEAIAEAFYHQLFEQLPAEGFDSHHVTTLSVKREGVVGTYTLNEAIQHRLNPNQETALSRGRFQLALGDKVMQNSNCYTKNIFNGSVGTIVDTEPKKHQLTVDYAGRHVRYTKSDLGELQLNYAGTVHRAQGSEGPAVITLIAPEHYILADRRLVNTAITRAQHLSILISTRKTLMGVLNNQRSYQRTTFLAERLRRAA